MATKVRNRVMDWPLTLTVADIQQIMRCSKPKALQIIHRPDFPKVIDGRRIFIGRDRFFQWYENQMASDAP